MNCNNHITTGCLKNNGFECFPLHSKDTSKLGSNSQSVSLGHIHSQEDEHHFFAENDSYHHMAIEPLRTIQRLASSHTLETKKGIILSRFDVLTRKGRCRKHAQPYAQKLDIAIDTYSAELIHKNNKIWIILTSYFRCHWRSGNIKCIEDTPDDKRILYKR